MPFQIRLVGMVNGKAERTTDVSFTLDDGTGRLDFIRWSDNLHESLALNSNIYIFSFSRVQLGSICILLAVIRIKACNNANYDDTTL